LGGDGDLVLENGDLQIVEDSDKLLQDILKILLTPSETGDPLNPWYGSLLSKNTIGGVIPEQIVIANAQSQIQNALEILMKVQDEQMRAGQQVTSDELLAAVKDVSVFRDVTDPRGYNIVLSVFNKSFTEIQTEFTQYF
jgi:hypothetical protein